MLSSPAEVSEEEEEVGLDFMVVDSLVAESLWLFSKDVLISFLLCWVLVVWPIVLYLVMDGKKLSYNSARKVEVVCFLFLFTCWIGNVGGMLGTGGRADEMLEEE